MGSITILTSLHSEKFFVHLLSSADFFSNILYRNTIRMSNGFGPDQDRHFVGADLGPNCLLRLSADNDNKSLKS